jgi:hypothetical protein
MLSQGINSPKPFWNQESTPMSDCHAIDAAKQCAREEAPSADVLSEPIDKHLHTHGWEKSIAMTDSGSPNVGLQYLPPLTT